MSERRTGMVSRLLLGLVSIASGIGSVVAQPLPIPGFVSVNGISDFESTGGCVAARVEGQLMSLAQASRYLFFDCSDTSKCVPVTSKKDFTAIDVTSDGQILGAAADGYYQLEKCGRETPLLAPAVDSCKPITSLSKTTSQLVVGGGDETSGCLRVASPKPRDLSVHSRGVTAMAAASGWILAFGHFGGSDPSITRVDVDGLAPITDVLTGDFSKTAVRQKFFINKIVAAKGEFWIATREGLLRYDPVSKKISKVWIPGDALEITALHAAKDALWIGTVLRRNPRLKGDPLNILDAAVFEVRLAGGGRAYRRCDFGGKGSISGVGAIGDKLVVGFDEQPHGAPALEIFERRDVCKVVDSDAFVD